MTTKTVVLATSARPWTIVHGVVSKRTATEITLTDARMCVYYGVDTRGALGLASRGPQSGSRVSGAVKSITIPMSAVEWIASASPEADAAWRAEPWS